MPGKNTTRITIELPNAVYREFLYLVLDSVNGDPLLYMDEATRRKHVENEYNFTPSTPRKHPPLRAKHVNLFATAALTKLVDSEEGKGTISFVKRAWTVLADGDVLRARKPRKMRKVRLSKAVRDAERARKLTAKLAEREAKRLENWRAREAEQRAAREA